MQAAGGPASPSSDGYRGTVVGIENGSVFFVQAASDQAKLASIDAKMDELMAQEVRASIRPSVRPSVVL